MPKEFLLKEEQLQWKNHIDSNKEASIDIIVLLRKISEMREGVARVIGVAEVLVDAGDLNLPEGLSRANDETLAVMIPGERVSVHEIAKRLMCSRVAAHCRLRELADKGLIQRFPGGDALLPLHHDEEPVYIKIQELAEYSGKSAGYLRAVIERLPVSMLPEHTASSAQGTIWVWDKSKVDDWLREAFAWDEVQPRNKRVPSAMLQMNVNRIYDALTDKPKGVAELAKEKNLTVAEVRTALKALDMNRMAEQARKAKRKKTGTTGWILACVEEEEEVSSASDLEVHSPAQ